MMCDESLYNISTAGCNIMKIYKIFSISNNFYFLFFNYFSVSDYLFSDFKNFFSVLKKFFLKNKFKLTFFFFFWSGALFSLNGPATVVRQKDPARPSLAAACRVSGLSRAVCSGGPGQQEACGAEGKGKREEWKI